MHFKGGTEVSVWSLLCQQANQNIVNGDLVCKTVLMEQLVAFTSTFLPKVSVSSTDELTAFEDFFAKVLKM